MKIIVPLFMLLLVSCDKNIGILFDVSGSMKESFDSFTNIDKIKQKKSDEIIGVLKNISKNIPINIFSILYGLNENPEIIDFIELLKTANYILKNLTSCERCIYYKYEIMKLLSNNGKRYCNIEEYLFSEEGPDGLLSEFFYNILKEEPTLVDKIYDDLPYKVKNKYYDKSTYTVNKAADWGFYLANILPKGLDYLIGTNTSKYMRQLNEYKDTAIEEGTKEITLLTIQNSFKDVIQVIAKQIMNQYKCKNNNNFKLTKGKDVINIIENLEKKIASPKKTTFNIIDLFENFIYGMTPLYTSYKHAFHIFEKNKNDNNILIIISDGLLNDYNIQKAQKEIIESSRNLGITIICIYLNSYYSNHQKKEFYNTVQRYFDEGAEFLFSISSKVNYNNIILKYFIKKKWKIPLNGIANLFYEINNSDDLNEFIQTINEALDHNDVKEQINQVIGDLLLDKIINTNYINQFKPEDQGQMGWCWAYSISSVIYLSSSRIFGRKLEKFENILSYILKLENAKKTDKDKDQGRPTFEVAMKHLSKFKLRGKEINSKEARIAVMEGRPCLARFELNKYQWYNFGNFFEKNPKGILNRKILETDNEFKNISNISGHAVVLISIEENSLLFLNSWGNKFGDNGYFRIAEESVLNNLKFMDIFWEENDLTNEEKDYYNSYFLNYIRNTSEFLTKSNLSIKDLENRKEKCSQCKHDSYFKDYKLIHTHQHHENDDIDYRKLKIKCPICQKNLEQSKISPELNIYLYINSIINDSNHRINEKNPHNYYKLFKKLLRIIFINN